MLMMNKKYHAQNTYTVHCKADVCMLLFDNAKKGVDNKEMDTRNGNRHEWHEYTPIYIYISQNESGNRHNIYIDHIPKLPD